MVSSGTGVARMGKTCHGRRPNFAPRVNSFRFILIVSSPLSNSAVLKFMPWAHRGKLEIHNLQNADAIPQPQVADTIYGWLDDKITGVCLCWWSKTTSLKSVLIPTNALFAQIPLLNFQRFGRRFACSCSSVSLEIW